ncbi:MAG: Gfo/Idh/MocA family protein [Promethearchaeota archaeon]
MADPVTFVVVGLGGISDSWLRVFNMSEDAEPVAFVDPDKSKFEKLKQWGDFAEKPTFNRLEDAYAEVESDATLVLTPPQYHARYLIEAMENLNHVITEKPFCTETNQLRHVLQRYRDIREETGEELVCVVNQQYRFMPRIEAIKKTLWSGEIGEPGFVVSLFNEPDYHFNRWWRQQHQDISFANWYIHHIDTMRYILGSDPESPAAKPVEVYARMFRVPWTKIVGESSIFLQVTFDNGVQWSYNASQEARGKPSPGQSEFIIHCSKGTIENPREGNPILTRGGGKDAPQEVIGKDFGDVGYKYPPSWDHTMALFVEAVRNEGKADPRLTLFDDNKWTIAIMFCARQSMVTGKPVDVREYMSRVVGPYF